VAIALKKVVPGSAICLNVFGMYSPLSMLSD
jgi:hypothetical protein